MPVPKVTVAVSSAAQRLLKVAIVGVPNAGKSTLINNIMSRVICPVSKRVHTTRLNQHISYLDKDAQVVFVDTPGLVNIKEIKKFDFPKDFVFGPENSVKEADVVAVIHDLSNAITRDKLDHRVRRLMEKFPDRDAVLILNKVDMLKHKRTLFDTVRYLTSGVVDGKPVNFRKSHAQRVLEDKRRMTVNNVLERARRRAGLTSLEGEGRKTDENGQKEPISEEEYDLNIDQDTKKMTMASFLEHEIREGLHKVGWPKFKDVFMISALQGDGVDLLREYFVVNARPSPWLFQEDFLTDVDPREFAIRVIKSLLLEYLPQEMPFKVTPKIDFWDETDSGKLKIVISLVCPRTSYYWRVTGPEGATLAQFHKDTEDILVDLLRVPIDLQILPVNTDPKAEEKSKKQKQ